MSSSSSSSSFFLDGNGGNVKKDGIGSAVDGNILHSKMPWPIVFFSILKNKKESIVREGFEWNLVDERSYVYLQMEAVYHASRLGMDPKFMLSPKFLGNERIDKKLSPFLEMYFMNGGNKNINTHLFLDNYCCRDGVTEFSDIDGFDVEFLELIPNIEPKVLLNWIMMFVTKNRHLVSKEKAMSYFSVIKNPEDEWVKKMFAKFLDILYDKEKKVEEKFDIFINAFLTNQKLVPKDLTVFTFAEIGYEIYDKIDLEEVYGFHSINTSKLMMDQISCRWKKRDSEKATDLLIDCFTAPTVMELLLFGQKDLLGFFAQYNMYKKAFSHEQCISFLENVVIDIHSWKLMNTKPKIRDQLLEEFEFKRLEKQPALITLYMEYFSNIFSAYHDHSLFDNIPLVFLDKLIALSLELNMIPEKNWFLSIVKHRWESKILDFKNVPVNTFQDTCLVAIMEYYLSYNFKSETIKMENLEFLKTCFNLLQDKDKSMKMIRFKPTFVIKKGLVEVFHNLKREASTSSSSSSLVSILSNLETEDLLEFLKKKLQQLEESNNKTLATPNSSASASASSSSESSSAASSSNFTPTATSTSESCAELGQDECKIERQILSNFFTIPLDALITLWKEKRVYISDINSKMDNFMKKKKFFQTHDLVKRECSICYDTETLIPSQCFHFYCESCYINTFLNMKNHCAMCKQDWAFFY
jgi:hypothetical protein